MNEQEFYNKIIAKYPQYSNMSKEELVPKMLERHPQYQSQLSAEIVAVDEPVKDNKDFIDKLVGMSPEEMAENGDWIASGLQQTAKDAITIPTEFFNQMLFNYPKALANKAGIEFPEPKSRAAQIVEPVAGLAGAIKSPIVKAVGGIVPGSGVVSKMAKGATIGGLYSPEQVDDLKSRFGQAAFGGISTVAIEGGIKASAALAKSAGKLAPRIIENLIRPMKRHWSYGKNPPKAIIDEKIIANSIDELDDKLVDKQIEVGKKIASTLEKHNDKRVNLTKITEPINEAIIKAEKSPRTNKAVIDRLIDARDDIMGVVRDESGKIVSIKKVANLTPKEAFDIKQQVADITRFTGNASDDQLVNQSLRKIYGYVKKSINGAVPGVKELNERFANLVGAKMAVENRIPIAGRNNLISLGELGAGGFAAVTAAIQSGGKALPAAIAGLGVGGALKALKTTAVRTRMAQLLNNMSKSQLLTYFERNPGMHEVLTKTYQATSPQLFNKLKDM